MKCSEEFPARTYPKRPLRCPASSSTSRVNTCDSGVRDPKSNGTFAHAPLIVRVPLEKQLEGLQALRNSPCYNLSRSTPAMIDVSRELRMNSVVRM